MSDADREVLANLIDAKKTKRKVTRSELIQVCQMHIAGMVSRARGNIDETGRPLNLAIQADIEGRDQRADPLHRIDDRDPLTRLMAHPGDPSYCRGWNQVKNFYEGLK